MVWLFVAVLAVVVGVVIFGRLRRGRVRPGAQKVNYCAVWDGDVLEFTRCKLVDGGIQVGSTIYPAGVYHVVQYAQESFYLVAADGVELADYRVFQAAKERVALSSMFDAAGDGVYWLQVAACIVPIAVAIWLSMSFGTLLSANASNQALIRQVSEQVSRMAQPTATPEVEK